MLSNFDLVFFLPYFFQFPETTSGGAAASAMHLRLYKACFFKVVVEKFSSFQSWTIKAMAAVRSIVVVFQTLFLIKMHFELAGAI